MVRKIFKKRKDNQNKIKPSGRKRKIFATIALAVTVIQLLLQLTFLHHLLEIDRVVL